MAHRSLTSRICRPTAGWVVLLLAAHPVPAQTAGQPSAEEQVLTALRNKEIGNHRLGDHDVPEAFLRRVGDRIIQRGYQSGFRSVVGGEVPSGAAMPTSGPASGPPPATPPTRSVARRLLPLSGAMVAVFVALAMARRRRRRAGGAS